MHNAVVIVLYLFVNTLFVYKYGLRQSYVPVEILTVFYIVIATVALVFSNRIIAALERLPAKRLMFFGLSGITAVAMIWLIQRIDSEALNVDRWSALELTVEGITEGLYPYTRVDHVGNMSSNFPGLAWLAVPFYLLGDVGYLQIFVFVLFAWYLWTFPDKKSSAFFTLVLFVTAPAILWEIAVKSDLVSNILLAYLFIEWWRKKYRDAVFSKPILLGAALGFFMCTRAVLLIPLALFYFRPFVLAGLRKQILFFTSAVVTAILICLPILLTVPDWETFSQFNPLTLQTDKAPIYAYLLLLLVFVIPFFKKDYDDRLFYSAVIIFMIPATSMLEAITDRGFTHMITTHSFDISYLSMCLPAVLVWFYRDKSRAITASI
ncbi:MAG: hypothetical protein AAF741_18480 [Bacteroidota bacterium]